MHPLFSLIRVSLGRAESLGAAMDVAAWHALLQTAKEQTLTGVLMEGIKRLPKDEQPETETMFQWLAAAERGKQLSRRLNASAAKLTARLERDGIRSVVLKGQGVSLLYPDPLTRTPGDIDLWMEGGRRRLVAYIRRYFPRERVVYHHMDFPVLRKADVTVEAHFTPSWMYSPVTNRRLQRWFATMWPTEAQHRAALPEGAGTVGVSTPAFNRVFIPVHIYRHLLDEGVGLRQLLDYYYVLLHDPATPAEKEEAARTLRSLGMARFSGALAYAMQELFGLETQYLLFAPDAKEGRFLIDEVMLAGNFGKYDTRFAHEREGDGHLRRFLRKQRRNLHFLAHYPSEVLWHPLWRLWHFFWRWGKGYL